MMMVPLPCDVMDRLDAYVYRNAVSREAVVTAALIMFAHSWEQMGSIVDEEDETEGK